MLDRKELHIMPILIGFVLLVFLVTTLLLIDYGTNKPSVHELVVNGSFVLGEYDKYISEFPSNRKVEAIIDSEDAKKKGEMLIRETFNMQNGKPYDPLEDCALAVYYDSSEEIWLVKGVLPPDLTGCTPGVIIRQNGDVLAIFYS